MHWIYISPHFDDAVLSCGGMIWEQTRKGDQVEIWTVCAGDPPKSIPFSKFALELHTRWGTDESTVAIRKKEDIEACQRVGATHRHLDTPDAIYRINPLDGEPLVQNIEAIFQPLPDYEKVRAIRLASEILGMLPAGVQIVIPLAMGGHVDHRLVRTALEAMQIPLWYFADYPYIVDRKLRVKDFLQDGAERLIQHVSDSGLSAWVFGISAYQSQLSTFWQNAEEMHIALSKYLEQGGGTTLWKWKE